MRRIVLALGVLAVLGIGAAAYMLWPVSGPPRDTTIAGDAASGAYLMRVGGCYACHTDTANGGAELAGGEPLVTQFGTFVAPNITSDPEHGIGAWTQAEFSRAVTLGVGREGERLYPVFPYEHYTLMSDGEIADLYAALMATEPVATPAAASDVPFPFNVRLSLAGWQRLFFTPGPFEPDPERDAVFNRGAYLALGPAHCVACHSPRNALGALDRSQLFAGSSGGPGGRAPAITAQALAEEGYDVPTLVQTLRDGFTPGFDMLGGTMREVISEGTSHWTDEDLTALATYLLTEDDAR
jgi:mono/diheme cytochrome c family protein